MSLATETSRTFVGARSSVSNIATIATLEAVSAEAETLDVTGDAVIGGTLTVDNVLKVQKYTTTSTPALSTVNDTRIYYNGGSSGDNRLKVSQGSGTYINLVGQNTKFGKITTADDTPTAIITHTPTHADACGLLEAKVSGRNPDSGDACVIDMLVGYKKVAGVMSLLGSTEYGFSYTDVSGVTAEFAAVGGSVEVQVTGENSESWSWTANVTIQGNPCPCLHP